MTLWSNGPETHHIVQGTLFGMALGFILFLVTLTASSGGLEKSAPTATTTPASTCMDSASIIAMAHSEHTCPVGSRIGVERLVSGSVLATCTCQPKPVEVPAPTSVALDEAELACE